MRPSPGLSPGARPSPGARRGGGEARGKAGLLGMARSKQGIVALSGLLFAVYMVFWSTSAPGSGLSYASAAAYYSAFASDGASPDGTPSSDDAAALDLPFVDPTLVNDGNPVPPDCAPLFPSVIVYNRIPKAGSTTLIDLLRRMSKANRFKVLIPKPKHDPAAARAAIAHALKSGANTVVVQHFNFPDLISPKLAYVNVMRNPVDRCISAYYYARWGPRWDSRKDKSVKRFGNVTLEECMDRPYDQLYSCFNCNSQGQARFFCGPEYGVCDRPSPQEMLRRAWYNMESQYFVGVTEDLTATVDVLEALYPSFFSGMAEALAATPPQRVNEEVDKSAPERTRRKIEEWTSVDSEIYRRVETKLKRVHAACTARKAAGGGTQNGGGGGVVESGGGETQDGSAAAADAAAKTA